MKKQKLKNNKWFQTLKKVREQHPSWSLSRVSKEASKLYKKIK